MKALAPEWFSERAERLAPKLLGKIVRKGSCAGVIVETEAYGADPASHARRLTARSALMRDTIGRWYVYFTYGMHWCANVTCDEGGAGAVLIRAVEPVEGIALMKRRRVPADRHAVAIPLRALTSGPAKFCRAFGITGKENGRSVGADFALYDAPEVAPEDIGISGRIGITRGAELPLRFFIKNNPFVSGFTKSGAPSRVRSR